MLRPYVVYYTVNTLSGGDPKNSRSPSDFLAVLVHNGSGEYTVYGGYRGSNEDWEPEQISLTQVGFTPLVPLTAPTSPQ